MRWILCLTIAGFLACERAPVIHGQLSKIDWQSPTSACEAKRDLPWRLRARMDQLRQQGDQACLVQLESIWRQEPQRLSEQARLVDELNRHHDCNIKIHSLSEQFNYWREISPPACPTLSLKDPRAAARRMRQLADVSLSDEAKDLELRADQAENLAPAMERLRALRQEILDRGIVSYGHRTIKVAHVGHPFEARDDSHWLSQYVEQVDALERVLRPEDRFLDGCPRPVCDDAIYRIAKAVADKASVERDSYDLLAYIRRHLDGERLAGPLGLDVAAAHLGQALSQPVKSQNGQWVCEATVLGGESVRVSAQPWLKGEIRPLPLVWLLWEAQALQLVVRSVMPTARVLEIRFQPAAQANDGKLVKFDRRADGLRLDVFVLNPRHDESVEHVRQKLHDQVRSSVTMSAEL